MAGTKRFGLAAVDPARGRALAWRADLTGGGCDCNSGFFPFAGALHVRARTLYVGGYFARIRGVHRQSAAAVDTRTARIRRWFTRLGPVAEGKPAVYAIGGDARHIYLDNGPLLALDLSRGRKLWKHRLGSIYTIVPDGRRLLVGGRARGGGLLRALDSATGRLTAWNPKPNAYVAAVATSSGAVFAGGGFSGLGGISRQGLAVIDEATGAPTSWDPHVEGSVTALAAANGTLYVRGGFTRIHGVERPALAAFDETTGALTSWQPAHGVRPDPYEGAYLVVTEHEVFVSGEAALVAFDRISGAATQLPLSGGIGGLAVAGSTLYVAGPFKRIGGLPRAGLAAIDVNTNAILPWNPGRPGGWTAIDATSGSIVGGRSTDSFAYRTAEVASFEGAKRAYYYFGIRYTANGQTHPRYLKLVKTGRLHQLDATHYRTGFSVNLPRRRPKGNAYQYRWAICTKDTEAQDGLGVSGPPPLRRASHQHLRPRNGERPPRITPACRLALQPQGSLRNTGPGAQVIDFQLAKG